MFNIGPGELMAILAVALIVLGPTRLPQAVRTVGRVVGELRRISSGFQDELRNAFEDSDVIDQLEKGPGATGVPADTPVVDTTGTLADGESGGESTTVPTEPVAGAEDIGEDVAGDEIDDDPPETDQRAAS